MGKDTMQPTRIDTDLYERFKNYVNDVHGQTRGHLRTEVENALRDYMKSEYGEEQLSRIESDVASLMQMMAEQNEKDQSDGGVTVRSDSQPESTRARQSSKPRANQPRKDKIEWLIEQLLEKTGTSYSSGEVPKSEISNIIETEYDFSSNTVDEYQQKIVSKLDAKEHPQHGVTVAWGNRYDDIVDELRDEADDEMSDL
jgi:hypothetical protein